MKSSSIFFSSLICGCLMHSVFGASLYSLSSAARSAAKPAPVTEVQANKMNIRQIEAGGIGYGQGYTTIEAFLAPTTFTSWLPFADLRGHRFDNGYYAFNTGLGLRYLAPSNCTIWGVNIYYDFRQTKQINFKQIGIGLEALGAHWDCRINGYIPFGKQESGYYQAKFKAFKRNNLIINVKRKFDMGGANAEAAYHWMPAKNIEVTGAVGPYYFQGKFNTYAAGGQARLKASFLNAISIEGIASYDNLFKWNGQGQLAFSIPIGPKLKTKGIASSNCSNKPALDLSAVQPVQRFEIIVADSHKQSKTAINPATGLPFHFIFVNNDPSSTPDGTAENPFVTLAQAQNGSSPGDLIYVFGSPILYGSAAAGGTVITLQDNQQLLGSGIAQPFKTTLGTVHAPATTPPMLSNGTLASNNIVNLGNNNLVSGLSFPQIDTQTNAAIVAVGITNATIQNNTFNFLDTSGSGTSAIIFDNCTGTLSVINNTLTTGETNPDLAILISPNPTTPGIYNIIGNSFLGSANSFSNFLLYNIIPVTTTYPDQLNMVGNTMSNGRGVSAQFQSSSPLEASLQFKNNTLNNLSRGLSIVGLLGSWNADVTGNTFNYTANNVLNTQSASHLTAQIDGNRFSGTTGASSLEVEAMTTASACIQLNSNLFDVPAALSATAGSQLILQAPIGNTGSGAYPTLSGVTFLPPGQTCQ